MDDAYPLVGLLLIVFLLIIKAAISHAKSAINNINEVNFRKAAEEDGDKRATLLVELFEKPASYIFAIDIIITTISVLIGYIYYCMIFKSFNKLLISWNVKNIIARNCIHILAVFLLVIIVALVGSLIMLKSSCAAKSSGLIDIERPS